MLGNYSSRTLLVFVPWLCSRLLGVECTSRMYIRLQDNLVCDRRVIVNLLNLLLSHSDVLTPNERPRSCRMARHAAPMRVPTTAYTVLGLLL